MSANKATAVKTYQLERISIYWMWLSMTSAFFTNMIETNTLLFLANWPRAQLQQINGRGYWFVWRYNHNSIMSCMLLSLCAEHLLQKCIRCNNFAEAEKRSTGFAETGAVRTTEQISYKIAQYAAAYFWWQKHRSLCLITTRNRHRLGQIDASGELLPQLLTVAVCLHQTTVHAKFVMDTGINRQCWDAFAAQSATCQRLY